MPEVAYLLLQGVPVQIEQPDETGSRRIHAFSNFQEKENLDHFTLDRSVYTR